MSTVMLDLASEPWVQRIGWALVHFLWQGTAVAVLLAAALLLLPRRWSQARWVAACAALGLMAVLPVATAWMVSVDAPVPVVAGPVTQAPPTADVFTLPPAEKAPEPGPAPAGEESASPLAAPVEVPHGAAEVDSATPWGLRLEQFLRPALPWSFAVWLVGVVVMSVWHLGGWLLLERTKRHGVRPAEGAIRDVFDRLLRRLRVSRPVRLLQSARVAVPTVAGWLRPVVLLPASALSGLSLEQMEAVLAHELAHVRRYDCLVRLIQAIVETLLFYHPAVWWVSRRIRQESEHCCDELALGVCPDRRTYAEALHRIAEQSGRAPRLAAAVRGGSLVDRIRRIVGLRPGRAGGDIRRWGAAAAAVFVLAALTVGAAIFYGRQADTGTPPATRPTAVPARALATQPARGVITPTPATAEVLCITDKWMLWRTHELIEATADSRAQMFTIRVYLQRRGQKHVRLVTTLRDTRVRWKATVMDDGTAVLNYRGRLAWVSPEGKVSSTPGLYAKLDGLSVEPLGLYPDGVILRSTQRRDEPIQAWFVPFKGPGLATDKRIPLTGEKGFRFAKAPIHYKILRSGDEFAWSDDAGLHIVNIANGARRRFPFAGGAVQAFDGKTAVSGRMSLNLKSGKSKRLEGHFTFVAVRNGIGYGIAGVAQAISAYGHPKKLGLLAVDLDTGRQRTPAKWPNAKVCYIADSGPMGQAFIFRVKWDYTPVLYVAEADGLMLWDGAAWRKFKWLTRIDPPATQPAGLRSFQLPDPEPGTLVGGWFDPIVKADYVFVGKVLKVDWARKQASKPTIKEFDFADWGIAQVQCVTPIRGVKAGRTLPVLVYPRRPYIAGEFISDAIIWGQADFKPGSQWLIFAGKDSSDIRGLPPKAAKAAKVLGVARMVTGKEPILAEAKQAVALHALPAGKKFAAFKELLAKGSLGGLAVAYAGDHIRYTNASPVDIALAINTGIQRSAKQEYPCRYFLFLVDELYRQVLGEREDPKLSATLQTMLLEDAPRFTEANDDLLSAYVGTLLYVFHTNDKFPYRLPDTLPESLAVANKKAVARALLRMAARMETIRARLHKLASGNPASGLDFQIEFHAQGREGLTKLARFLDPTATQPKDAGTPKAADKKEPARGEAKDGTEAKAVPAAKLTEVRPPEGSKSGEIVVHDKRVIEAPNPSSAELGYADQSHCVWVRGPGFEHRDSREHVREHVRSYTTRYYVQKRGSATARLAFQMTAVYRRRVLAVTPGGVAVLTGGAGDLVLAEPGRPPRNPGLRIDGKPAHALMGWADGILVQPYRLNERAPVYFVPLTEKGPRIASAVRLTDAAGVPVVTGVWFADKFGFVRCGQEIAWHDGGNLHVFDLSTGRARATRTASVPRDGVLKAFDGKLAVIERHEVAAATHVVDAATGNRIAGFSPSVLEWHFAAFRKGIAYEIVQWKRKCSVLARRVADPSRKPDVLATFPVFEGVLIVRGVAQKRPFGGDLLNRQAVLPAPNGIRAWNGSKWVLVRWVADTAEDREDIAWGKAAGGVRVGLSPRMISLDPDARTFTVRVWYENVSRKPQEVPVHKGANMYKLMFAGSIGGKPFYVAYVVMRAETIPPGRRPLQPGKRFSETFRLGSMNRRSFFWGVPKLNTGDSLTLRAGWTPFGDAGTAAHWNDPRTRTSGAITVRRERTNNRTGSREKVSTDKSPRAAKPPSDRTVLAMGICAGTGPQPGNPGAATSPPRSPRLGASPGRSGRR